MLTNFKKEKEKSEGINTFAFGCLVKLFL